MIVEEPFNFFHVICQPVQTEGLDIANPYDGQAYPPSLFAFFAKVTDEVCEILAENEDPFLNEVFADYHRENEEVKTLEAEVTKLFELKDENVPPEVNSNVL